MAIYKKTAQPFAFKSWYHGVRQWVSCLLEGQSLAPGGVSGLSLCELYAIFSSGRPLNPRHYPLGISHLTASLLPMNRSWRWELCQQPAATSVLPQCQFVPLLLIHAATSNCQSDPCRQILLSIWSMLPLHPSDPCIHCPFYTANPCQKCTSYLYHHCQSNLCHYCPLTIQSVLLLPTANLIRAVTAHCQSDLCYHFQLQTWSVLPLLIWQGFDCFHPSCGYNIIGRSSSSHIYHACDTSYRRYGHWLCRRIIAESTLYVENNVIMNIWVIAS